MWSSNEIGAKKPEKLQLLKLQSNNEIHVCAFFSAVSQLLSFLDADCLFRYLVTLHERFIYLEMKLLPKRKLAVALLL